MSGKFVPKLKMRKIDCSAIVQPGLGTSLPNERRAKEGSATLCRLTRLLANGQQEREFKRDIKYGLRAALTDFS